MMNFRIIKDSIIENILEPAEAGRYRTIGYQKQAKSSKATLNNNRTVQLYFDSGDFDGRYNGPANHKINFNIDLTVSTNAKADLTTINNPVATPTEIATAIDAMQIAAERNDYLLDELVDIVWNLIMDARNIDLGVNRETYPNLSISKRYIDTVQKDNPLPRGEYVTNTAQMRLTCSVTEEPPGDSGLPGDTFNNTINIGDDPNANTGVTQVN